MTSDGSTSSTQLNTVNQPSDEEFSPGQLIIEFDDESSIFLKIMIDFLKFSVFKVLKLHLV